MIKSLAILFLLFNVTVVSAQQDFDPVAERDLDRVIDTLADEVTGLVVFAETPDGVYSHAAGVAERETATPLDVDDSFRIGSITKMFTSVIVLQLMEEGVLNLDDTLNQWVPATGIPYADQITVRQLLNHTSGIFDPINVPENFDRFFSPENFIRDWMPSELVEYILEGEPEFLPGEGWSYSNSNYTLLGLIIETATDEAYADQLRTRILDPLSMESAYLAALEPARNGLVHSYTIIEDEYVDLFTWNASVAWAAGGLVMNAVDLATFARALFEGELFQNADTLTEMTTLHPAVGYGLGVQSVIMPGYFGHDGGTPGFYATLIYATDSNTAAVVFINEDIDPAIVLDPLTPALLRLIP